MFFQSLINGSYSNFTPKYYSKQRIHRSSSTFSLSWLSCNFFFGGENWALERNAQQWQICWYKYFDTKIVQLHWWEINTLGCYPNWSGFEILPIIWQNFTMNLFHIIWWNFIRTLINVHKHLDEFYQIRIISKSHRLCKYFMFRKSSFDSLICPSYTLNAAHCLCWSLIAFGLARSANGLSNQTSFTEIPK